MPPAWFERQPDQSGLKPLNLIIEIDAFGKIQAAQLCRTSSVNALSRASVSVSRNSDVGNLHQPLHAVADGRSAILDAPGRPVSDVEFVGVPAWLIRLMLTACSALI